MSNIRGYNSGERSKRVLHSGCTTVEQKHQNVGFPKSCIALPRQEAMPCLLAARATSNAQITRHGARPHPKHAPSVYASPLRAPQLRARGKTHDQRRNARACAQKVHLVHIRARSPFGMWMTSRGCRRSSGVPIYSKYCCTLVYRISG